MQTGAKLALVGLCICTASSLCTAQSLGDLARQERARRGQQTQHAPVLTNEDLKRERILPPAPPAAAAQGMPAPVPPAPSSATLPVSTHPGPNVPLWKVAEQPGFSLGSYARALREEKKQREAEQNAKAVPHPEEDRGASAIVRSISRPALADLSVQRPAPAPSAKRQAIAEPRTKFVAPRAGRHANAVAPAARRHVSAIASRAQRRHIVRAQEPDPTRVTVQPGDSLWRIAADLYGDGRLWTALWHANPGIRNPNRIYAGQTLRMPTPVQITSLRQQIQSAASRGASRNFRSAPARVTSAPAAAPTARLE